MPTRVQVSTGETVEFPDGMSDDEIAAVLIKEFPPASPVLAQDEAMTNEWRQGMAKSLEASGRQWSDVPAEARGNIIPSAKRFVGGLWDAATSPVQTVKGIADMGAGALRAGVGAIAPGLASRLDQLDAPETTERLDRTATAAGEFLKDRYGSENALKATLARDPIGAAADISTLFTGGAMLAPKAGTVANTLRTAAKFTDPLTPVIGAAKLAAKAPAPIIGMTSGVGAENLREAYRAGREGGESGQIFRDNLTGKASQTDVLETAKQGLETIRAQRGANYTREARDLMRDPTPLDTGAIARAAHEAELSVQHRGMPTVSPAEWANIKGITGIVEDWRSRPGMTDVAGLDALKRRLDSAFPESPQMNQAQRIATSLRNTVKKTITDQVPKYADLMSDYEKSLNMQREIERGLSLGRKSSQDTALRKLQSLGRNNVATNYGGRLRLADQLKAVGANVMPAIAGQALSSVTPRGLQSLSGIGSLAASVMHNPMWAATLPFQSPLAMGYLSHTLGRGSRIASPVTSRINPRFFTPAQRIGQVPLAELEQERKRRREQMIRAQRQDAAMGIGY